MPIRQFFYFDAIECLPENVFQGLEEIPTPKLPTEKSRYYSQEIVFGTDFQEKIRKSKYFVVKTFI
jgi:ubiquitin-activating enzyme E1